MIFQIYEWLSKVVRQLQEPHTSEEDSLKTASRNHSKIKLEMSTCSKQYETLKLMHSQNQESPPESPKGNSLPLQGNSLPFQQNSLSMKNLEELWITAQLLVDKKSRDIEDRKVLEDFEQKISLLECHLNDQVCQVYLTERRKSLICFMYGFQKDSVT